MKIGDKINITIEKLIFGGEGLGRIDNFPVFVPMSVPGDEVEAEINAFAEALRDEKFSDEDFVTKLI